MTDNQFILSPEELDLLIAFATSSRRLKVSLSITAYMSNSTLRWHRC